MYLLVKLSLFLLLFKVTLSLECPLWPIMIVILDHLSLGSRAKDEIYPDVSELVTNMDRMTSCPPTIKESVKVWEETLKPMAASDEMTGNNSQALV